MAVEKKGGDTTFNTYSRNKCCFVLINICSLNFGESSYCDLNSFMNFPSDVFVSVFFVLFIPHFLVN